MEKLNDTIFPIFKSIISDCICKTMNLVQKKIPENCLNALANEYADRLLQEIPQPQYLSEKEIEEIISDPQVDREEGINTHDRKILIKAFANKLPKQMMSEAEIASIIANNVYYTKNLKLPMFDKAAKALANKIPKPEEENKEPIKELRPEELCVCDYGDTNRIIDYILALNKKLSEVIRELNALSKIVRAKGEIYA